jgi:hypothetical protein
VLATQVLEIEDAVVSILQRAGNPATLDVAELGR